MAFDQMISKYDIQTGRNTVIVDPGADIATHHINIDRNVVHSESENEMIRSRFLKAEQAKKSALYNGR